MATAPYFCPKCFASVLKGWVAPVVRAGCIMLNCGRLITYANQFAAICICAVRWSLICHYWRRPHSRENHTHRFKHTVWNEKGIFELWILIFSVWKVCVRSAVPWLGSQAKPLALRRGTSPNWAPLELCKISHPVTRISSETLSFAARDVSKLSATGIVVQW